ncbi:endonuclease domain-containing protein [Pseudolysinimonas sp.]
MLSPVTPRSPAPLPQTFDGTHFSTAAGRAGGLHRERLRRRDLDARVHGARGPAGVADTLLGRCRLFAARLPEGTFFSHVTAAQLYGVPLPSSRERSQVVHASVVAPRRAPHAKGLRGHSRAVFDGDVVEFAGIRTSSPERLVFELAPMLSLPDLVAVVDFLIHERDPWCTALDLGERARRGDALARSRKASQALGLADPRAESHPESIVRVALTLAGIPPTAINPTVVVFGRRLRIDLAYLTEKVAVEYQGAYHLTPEQRARDMSRRSWLEAAGWTVVEANLDDLADLNGLVVRVRAALTRV